MISPKQKQVLDFVTSYTSKKGFSPSHKEIAKKLGIKTVSTIHQHLSALQEKGYIHKQKNQQRSVLISSVEKMISIPLLGTIAAGRPIEAIEQREKIAIPQNQLLFPGNYYALRVAGNSMIDEDINDTDIVLVRQQNTAKNGEKVVALIDNYETTLKKFYREKNHIRLQPANKQFDPIIIKEDQVFEIQGVVMDVIKESRSNLQEVKEKDLRESSLPLNQIILGDAIQELRKLPNESCDIIIADPPYNIGKDFGNNFDKMAMADYVRWSNSWVSECVRVMKPSATMFIYGFSEILAHISVEIPLNKRWLIWHYTNKNVASLNFWQRSHESIICAWKDKPVFNRDDVREPYTEGFLNGAAGKIRKDTIGRFSNGGKTTVYNAHEGGALPRDVLKFPALAGGAGMSERWFLCKTCNKVYGPRELKNHLNHDVVKHPTQKPLELTKKLIRSSVSKNSESVVLIPFVGSGSECLATKKLGHSFIGFELNPDYVKMAQEAVKMFKKE